MRDTGILRHVPEISLLRRMCSLARQGFPRKSQLGILNNFPLENLRVQKNPVYKDTSCLFLMIEQRCCTIHTATCLQCFCKCLGHTSHIEHCSAGSLLSMSRLKNSFQKLSSMDNFCTRPPQLIQKTCRLGMWCRSKSWSRVHMSLDHRQCRSVHRLRMNQHCICNLKHERCDSQE